MDNAANTTVMNITKQMIFYLVLAALVSAVVSHFTKRELEKRFPVKEP